ncbi:hypothetical protein IEO21_05857 [Rhodonia placenta]|uniref:Uncharacterized protein n=1 Tax=Rhodonia placenta TaxID=104341 RepID=A0A8H7P1E6_9APHY|nr:hypothetical protein IEO21_05857 [Postia placenta]
MSIASARVVMSTARKAYAITANEGATPDIYSFKTGTFVAEARRSGIAKGCRVSSSKITLRQDAQETQRRAAKMLAKMAAEARTTRSRVRVAIDAPNATLRGFSSGRCASAMPHCPSRTHNRRTRRHLSMTVSASIPKRLKTVTVSGPHHRAETVCVKSMTSHSVRKVMSRRPYHKTVRWCQARQTKAQLRRVLMSVERQSMIMSQTSVGSRGSLLPASVAIAKSNCKLISTNGRQGATDKVEEVTSLEGGRVCCPMLDGPLRPALCKSRSIGKRKDQAEAQRTFSSVIFDR